MGRLVFALVLCAVTFQLLANLEDVSKVISSYIVAKMLQF